MSSSISDLDHFAKVLFTQNKNDRTLAISADLRDVTECFCFCLDLLCRGMILLYGKYDENQRKRKVDLDTLTLDQLDFLRGRMLLCGIKMHYRVLPISVLEDAGIPCPKEQKIELPNLDAMFPSDPLESYKVDIFTQGLHIQLYFELTISAGGIMAKACHHGAPGSTGKNKYA